MPKFSMNVCNSYPEQTRSTTSKNERERVSYVIKRGRHRRRHRVPRDCDVTRECITPSPDGPISSAKADLLDPWRNTVSEASAVTQDFFVMGDSKRLWPLL
uniref:Uncharacterized protein n=1 Tax=Steinernema glaseri TaxID=37863 RepID=A0A1I7Z5C6_9BILA